MIALPSSLGSPSRPAMPQRRASVENGEVDRLGLVARVPIDPAEQLLRGQAMDVDAAPESSLELRHVGHMGGQPKLDLAVVGGEQFVARLGDEGIADLAADLGPDRDVLKVRIVRRQAAGLRAGHRIARVDPPRLLVDLRLERVGVGGLELGQLAPSSTSVAHSTPSPASRSSSLTSVEYCPLLPLRPPFRPIRP